MKDNLTQNSRLDLQLDRADGSREMQNGFNNEISLDGHYPVIEHRNAAGDLIGLYELKNGITNQGKNSLLGIMFHDDTQIANWYFGLIDNSGFTAVAAGDTLASHSGWSENNSYSGNRIQWVPGASSGQSITNPSVSTFTMTGTATLWGVFICSAASGTSGTLWSTAGFASTVPVNNGDTLKITYTVSC